MLGRQPVPSGWNVIAKGPGRTCPGEKRQTGDEVGRPERMVLHGAVQAGKVLAVPASESARPPPTRLFVAASVRAAAALVAYRQFGPPKPWWHGSMVTQPSGLLSGVYFPSVCNQNTPSTAMLLWLYGGYVAWYSSDPRSSPFQHRSGSIGPGTRRDIEMLTAVQP